MSLIILNENLVDDSDISMVVGTENAQFPLTNISHDFTTKVFRSNENSIEILIDLKTTVEVNSFAVVGSSVTGLGFGDMTIQGSLSSNFTGATEVNVDVSAEHNFGYVLFTPDAPFRFWKITVSNTGGDYVEISNLFLGAKTEITTNNISMGSLSYTNSDNSKIVENKYGQKFIDEYNKIKMIKGNMEYVNKAELTEINNIFIQKGRSNPLWFILDKDSEIMTDGNYILSGYFYFEKDLVWTNSGPCLFNVALELKEAT